MPDYSPAPWHLNTHPDEAPNYISITDAQAEPVIYGECLNADDASLLARAPQLLAEAQRARTLLRQWLATHEGGCECIRCQHTWALVDTPYPW